MPCWNDLKIRIPEIFFFHDISLVLSKIDELLLTRIWPWLFLPGGSSTSSSFPVQVPLSSRRSCGSSKGSSCSSWNGPELEQHSSSGPGADFCTPEQSFDNHLTITVQSSVQSSKCIEDCWSPAGSWPSMKSELNRASLCLCACHPPGLRKQTSHQASQTKMDAEILTVQGPPGHAARFL